MDFAIGIIAIIACIVLFRYFRKSFMAWNASDPGPPKGFTLGDLRDMLRKGQITQAEFDRAKAMIVDAEQRGNARPAQGRPTGGFPVIDPNSAPDDGKS